jgi:Tfp pilus assembly protein PilN
MRPIVNLARKPFRNRRLFWLAILGIFVVSAYAGLNAIQEKVRLEREIIAQQEATRNLTGQVSKKSDSKEPISTLTITPDKNRELLAASELIERRAFSWSQLLNDIERHIPANVRVLRIAVNKVKAKDPNAVAAGAASSSDRTVALTLEVVGKSSTDVTRMMTDFERSGVFTVYPREKKLIEGMTDVQFTLDVEYTPPLPRGLRQSTGTQLAENRK